MKNLFNLVSLLSVGGYAVAQFARTAGYQMPAAINATNLVVVLTFAVVALLMVADYGAPRRRLAAPSREAAADTQPAPGRSRPRRAYSIRRGTEAARLGSPSAAIRFPAAPRVRCDRAA